MNDAIEDEIEHTNYSLRYADSDDGIRCVVIDDLMDWMLSIVDGDAASKDQCDLVKIIVDRLTEIKNL